MAATVTRRSLRRVRSGSRHTYRALRRHRAVAAIGAVVAAATIGAAAVSAGDLPGTWNPPPPPAMGHQHGPLADGMPGWMGPHRH